jgi:SAM-dependent methyltransferase
MFADESLLHEESELFGGVFNDWRVKRVRKLEHIFSREWFKGKKVLELACGFGNIGLYLKSIGADVTFADARQESLDTVKKKDENATLMLLDQEKPWILNQKYDLILHFGLLYNLNNWERDLRTTIQHAKFIALETAVARYSNSFECKIVKPEYPSELYGPFSGTGTLVSSANIESVFQELGADYHRYDDSDLNLGDNWGEYRYDWKEEYGPRVEYAEIPVVNDWDNIHLGGRRFWIIRNNSVVSSLNLFYK